MPVFPHFLRRIALSGLVLLALPLAAALAQAPAKDPLRDDVSFCSSVR